MSANNNKMSALAHLKARRQQAASGGSLEAGTSGTAAAPTSAAGTADSASADPAPPASSPARPSAVSAAAAAASAAAAQPFPPSAPPPEAPLPTRQVEAFTWQCGTCQRECVPVRSESRCLCGHRLREHDPASTKAPSRCKAAKCSCRGFFFIVAEGAWILRCRCKHKHVEHDAATHACAKAGCSCRDFDSPWVCNCDHPWSDHKQLVQVKEVVSVRDMMGGLALAEVGGGGPAREVNDYSALKRGEFGTQ